MDAERVPVIVGAGQVNDRDDVLSPAELMRVALERAEDDGGARWLADADSVSVVAQIAWPGLGDLSRPLAEALGARPAECRQSPLPHGDMPIRYLDEAAHRIASGAGRIALVAGAEALRTARKRMATDALRARRREGHPSYAQAHGLVAPVDVYPLYENACRAAWGQTLAEGQAESAAMWAAMSRVAADSDGAWLRTPVSAEAIATPSADNRPLAFPYTKLTVANASVNQGAGFIVTSLAEARRRGVAEDRLVFVGRGAAAKEPKDILARDRYDASASMQVVLEETLSRNALTIEQIDHAELYSCFPCVPKLARRILGWPVEKPVSVFGGLTFGGGPIGNYMSHAVAAMAGRLRREGGFGLLFANGGFATDNHAIVVGGEPLSTRPGRGPADAPHAFDVQAAADAARGMVPALVEEHEGAATVETYTVFYDREGEASGGVVVARTPEGARTLARVEGHEVTNWLTGGQEEPVGQPGRIADGVWRLR